MVTSKVSEDCLTGSRVMMRGCGSPTLFTLRRFGLLPLLFLARTATTVNESVWCDEGRRAVSAVLASGGAAAAATYADPGTYSNAGSRKNALLNALALLSSPYFRTHRDRYVLARDAMAALADVEANQPGTLSEYPALHVHRLLRFCPTELGETEYAAGRGLARWALSTAENLAVRKWLSPPTQRRRRHPLDQRLREATGVHSPEANASLLVLALPSPVDTVSGGAWVSTQGMLVPTELERTQPTDSPGKSGGSRQVTSGSPWRMRFEADQLAYLVATGSLPRAPFLTYAAALSQLAELLKRNTPPEAIPKGRSADHTEYVSSSSVNLPIVALLLSCLPVATWPVLSIPSNHS
jgi:hypothetical protein